IGRGRREVDGKIRSSGVDGSLNVAGSVVHVAIQIELEGDAGAAEGADGGHFGDAGNLAEAFFEWSSDRGSDRGGVRAGQGGGDRDDRIINAGDGGDRKEL